MIDSQLKVPDEWVYWFNKINEVVDRVALVGGACRDLWTGKEVKDLDFFIFDPHQEALEPIEELFKDFEQIQLVPEEYCGFDDAVDYVMGFRNDEGLEINIIFHKKDLSFEELIDRCDFGICQIGFDGEKVKASQKFYEDIGNQTFTVCRGETVERINRSLRRYTKLVKKYQDWQLILPAKFLNQSLPDQPVKLCEVF